MAHALPSLVQKLDLLRNGAGILLQILKPQLEYQQRPQPVAVIAPPAVMLVEELPHELRRHNTARQKSRTGQMIPQQLAQGAAEPVGQRHTESHLAASQ